MNLFDVLGVNRSKPAAHPAESAESAESQQACRLQRPQTFAETCGKLAGGAVIRTFPQAPADSAGRATARFPHNPHNPQASALNVEESILATPAYFQAHGVHLLPDDMIYLLGQLPKDTRARNAAIGTYIETWLQALDAEPVHHRKDNAARFAANTWLRLCFKPGEQDQSKRVPS